MSDTPRRLKDLRVADLKVELENRGLTTSGVKAVLAERLKDALVSEGINVDEHDFNKTEEATKPEVNAEDEKAESAEEACDQEEMTGSLEDVEDKESPGGEEEPVSKADESCQEEPVAVEEEESAAAGDIVDEANTEKDEDGEQEVKEADDDSLNLMVGDEDNLFGEEDKTVNGIPGSPPRPETAPVKHPFTSKDTINLSSRSEKPPSENSSMWVNPDESQSVASHDSIEGTKDNDKNGSSGMTTNTSESDSKQNETSKSDESTSDMAKNLWVSGLNSHTKAAELKTVFSAIGRVSGAKIVTNSKAAGARCFGYVSMLSSEDAAKCIEKLNKTELNGSMIIVELATSHSRPEKEDLKRSVERAHKHSSRDRDGRREDRYRGHSSSHTSFSSVRRSHEPLIHRTIDNHRSAAEFRREERRSESSRGGYHPRTPAYRRDDHRSHHSDVLTFSHIKDQRKKELDREEERRQRDRDRRKIEEEERRRKDALRRQREEEDKLRREREELKREREKLEREKVELMKFERERQRLEREKLEREKMELERLRRTQMDSRGGGDDRRAMKRSAGDRDPYVDIKKRSGHRDEFQTNRGNFDNSRRAPDDRSGMNRYGGDRSGQREGGSQNVRGGPSGRDMGGSRSMTSSRDQGSSRYESARDMGGNRNNSSRDIGGSSRDAGSRDMGGSRDGGRMSGGQDYNNRSSRSGQNQSGSSMSSSSNHRASGMGGSHSGSHGGSHSSSNWSGGKGGFEGGSGSGNFAGDHGSRMGGWNRSVSGGVQNRNVMPAMNLQLGSMAPFNTMSTGNAFGGPIGGGGGMGGSSNNERFDAYNKSSMMNQNRRY